MVNTSIKLSAELHDFCRVTARAIGKVEGRIGLGKGPAFISNGWKAAYSGNTYRVVGDDIIFHISIDGPNGAEARCKCTLRKSTKSNEVGKSKGGKPYFTYAVDILEGKARAYSSFRAFASIPSSKDKDGKNLFRELAKMALPEPWSFSDKDGTEILESYLNSIFLRVEDEEKIAYANDGDAVRYAAFNTGLVDKRFKDIYCLCVKPQGSKAWKVEAFCTEGSGWGGKVLSAVFGSKLPDRAKFFNRSEDALYNPTLPLRPDYNHLMMRLGRIDLGTLRELVKGEPKAIAVLDAAEKMENEWERDNYLNKELAKVELSDRTYCDIMRRMEDASAVAVARARYTYASALPAWNRKDCAGSNLYFCLPLCLLDDNHADVALVAALKGDGENAYYEGATLYSLPMAYQCSRTVQCIGGLANWVQGAFPTGKREEGRSDFESTVALDLTPVPAPSPVPIPEQTATLVIEKGKVSREVRDGFEIGVLRRMQEKIPDILLPTDTEPRKRSFYCTSQHHGVFHGENGSWRYEHRGRQETVIYRKNGEVVRLVNKGDACALADGDSLSFAGSQKCLFRVG